MNRMIRKIYSQRYLKIIWVICALIALFYAFSAYQAVSGWQSQKNYLFSDEFVNEDFKLHSDDYAKTYTDNGDPVYYHSIDEYRKEQLSFYNQVILYLPTTRNSSEQLKADEGFVSSEGITYQPGFAYISSSWYSNGNDSLTLMVFIVFILGFLLFFIDQKTNFNRFLFTLAAKRKKVFTSKIAYIGLPLILSLIFGILINVLIQYYGIPHAYLNASLPQLLYSGLSHLFLLIFVFSAGCFFGVLLGNLVFGPLALLLGSCLLFFVSVFYYNLVSLLNLFLPDTRFFDLSGLLISYPQKSAAPWYILLALGLLSILFFYLAEKVFSQISLENDGHFITVPRLQFPAFLTIFIGLSAYLLIMSINWSYFTASVKEKAHMQSPLIFTLITLAVCLISSFLLVYLGDIHKWWIERREMRLSRKII